MPVITTAGVATCNIVIDCIQLLWLQKLMSLGNKSPTAVVSQLIIYALQYVIKTQMTSRWNSCN